MKSNFKFINRKENIKISILIVTISFLFILMNYYLNNQYSKGVSNLLFGISAFTIAYIRFIRLKTSIEEIIIEDKKIKFYFFNKKKSSIVVNKNELRYQINENIILFQNKGDGLIIGKAFKNQIEEVGLWIDLCKALELE